MDEENMVDYLERARANIEAEVSYEVDRELTVVQALVGIGLELRRLNKRLASWDDNGVLAVVAYVEPN